MSDEDVGILTAALRSVLDDYKRQDPPPTLLGGGPSAGAIATLVEAIGRCDGYREIAGKVLFSGGSGPIVDAHGLAVRLFDKGMRADDVEEAVAWLVRLMTTRKTTGLFKAVF